LRNLPSTPPVAIDGPLFPAHRYRRPRNSSVLVWSSHSSRQPRFAVAAAASIFLLRVSHGRQAYRSADCLFARDLRSQHVVNLRSRRLRQCGVPCGTASKHRPPAISVQSRPGRAIIDVELSPRGAPNAPTTSARSFWSDPINPREHCRSGTPIDEHRVLRREKAAIFRDLAPRMLAHRLAIASRYGSIQDYGSKIWFGTFPSFRNGLPALVDGQSAPRMIRPSRAMNAFDPQCVARPVAAGSLRPA